MKYLIGLLILLGAGAALAQERDCYAPWGAYVRHGSDVMAYKDQRPTGGARCEYQYRRCYDGHLSGWYQYGSCQEDYSCNTIEFGILYHFQSVTAYYQSDVWAPNRCQSETRTCMYGQLSGSYRYSYCREHN